MPFEACRCGRSPAGGCRRDRGRPAGRCRRSSRRGVGAAAAPMHPATAVKTVSSSRRKLLAAACSSWASTLSRTSESELVLMCRRSDRNIALQLFGIREVAVVGQHQAEGRIHVERLRLFGCRSRARRRVAHVGDTPGTGRSRMLRVRNTSRTSPEALCMWKRPPGRRDAGGVLPPVLEHLQAIIKKLIDGVVATTPRIPHISNHLSVSKSFCQRLGSQGLEASTAVSRAPKGYASRHQASFGEAADADEQRHRQNNQDRPSGRRNKPRGSDRLCPSPAACTSRPRQPARMPPR